MVNLAVKHLKIENSGKTIIRKVYFEGLRDLFLVIIVGFWLFNFSNLNDNSIIISTLVFSIKVSQNCGSIITSIRVCLYSLPGFKKLKEISKELNRDLYTCKTIINASSEKVIVNSFKWETIQNLRIKKYI